MRSSLLCILSVLLLLSILHVTKQQDVEANSLNIEDYDDTDEMSQEEIDAIMKEMEEMVDNDNDNDSIADQTVHVSDTNAGTPTAPPTLSQRQSSSSTSEEKRRSTMEYLRSKRKSANAKSSKKKSKNKTKDKNGPSEKENAGGAYYGGDIDRDKKEAYKQQQQRQQKQQSTTSTGSTSNIKTGKMSSMSNNRFQELENRLSENVRINMAYAEQQHAERDRERQSRRSRYSISRKFAAPVERIVTIYDDIRTDLYMVLDVPRNADEFALKRQYRFLALQIHPDKNPHPDAKAAFDAIQDAYDVLANPSKRKEYDKELSKIARSRAWTSKKLQKRLQEMWDNLKSQILVAWYQYRRGEEIEDLQQWKVQFMANLNALKHIGEHLVLLPSTKDRLLFVNELWWKHKWWLLTMAVLMPNLSALFLKNINI